MSQSDNISMKVEFSQTINIQPPNAIKDEVMAHEWLEADTQWILRDAIDVDRGNVEVLEINEM